MPLEGLPLTLEAMLSTLLLESPLSSFKVDANTNRTVVILRFVSTTGDQHGGPTSQSSATFKRKSASQIERDRKRTVSFQQQQQQQQQQQIQQQHFQASDNELQEISLPASTSFSSQPTPLGLSSIEIVNTPLRSPTESRASRGVRSNTHQTAQNTDEATRMAHRVSSNTQHECTVSKQQTVQISCGGGGESGADNTAEQGDVISQATSLESSLSQLLEHVTVQHRQIQQQQQRQQQELASRHGTGRPPPSRYPLRSLRK